MIQRIFLTLPIVVLVFGAACSAEVPALTDDDEDVSDADELKGAGGRDINEYWPTIDVPLSENTRLLSYDQLRNEVERATGLTWTENGADLWLANRDALGGADYVNTWHDDRLPSAQKLSVIRRMAFSICEDLVEADSGRVADQRTFFTTADPSEQLSRTDTAVSAQIDVIFERFYFASPVDEERDALLDLLETLQSSSGPEFAWRGLCVSQLASMRFLTY